jgi:hypothetical protein
LLGNNSKNETGTQVKNGLVTPRASLEVKEGRVAADQDRQVVGAAAQAPKPPERAIDGAVAAQAPKPPEDVIDGADEDDSGIY